MTEYVAMRGGAPVGFDREGDGLPIVLVGGALQQRSVDEETRRLTTELAARGFTAVHYDRPGRGDSGGAAPFTLAQEVAAVRALMDDNGGSVVLYGSSSGAAIALAAAARLDGVVGLILWEPPFGAEGGSDGAEFLAGLREVVARGDDEQTVRHFMRDMPPEWFTSVRQSEGWPSIERAAPTLAADAEALAWTQSAPRRQLWGGITVPTLVVLGTATLPFFDAVADAVVSSLADAKKVVISGSDHGWDPADLAEAIAQVRAALPQHRTSHSPRSNR